MEYSLYTNKGDRQKNEDNVNYAQHKDSFCFVLADGLGGHGGGEVASKIAVDTICAIFSDEGYSSDFFDKAFTAAQKAVIEEQEKNILFSQMKTTIVVLVVDDKLVHWAHIGDSRLYYLKNRRIKKRTLDHSVPQIMAISGLIKEKDIRHHSDRNRLLRVIGVKGENPDCEVMSSLKLAGNQAFLLCSDGYWELIEDSDIEKCLKTSKCTNEWLEKMNDIVCQNGKGLNMDNYTAIAVIVNNRGLFGFSR